VSLDALAAIEAGTAHLPSELGGDLSLAGKRAERGVVKVGFSWEARGVRAFEGADSLASRLELIACDARSTSPAVFVQRRLEHVICEIRHYVVGGAPA
jgi:hypothetical protein